MGRQVRFYMSEADEKEFFDWAHRLCPTRLVSACLGPEALVESDRPGGPLPGGHVAYWLWRTTEDGPPSRGDTGRRCVEVTSEAVEFVRTGVSGDRLLVGRLWIDTNVERPKGFLDWYGHLAGWIKKRYRRDDHGDYWGPHAQVRWEATQD
jgi:hypothetical protein